MPGMVAFGRRWSVATDDFIIVGIVDSIFFLCWWCWSVAIYSFFRNSQGCACQSGTWCLLLQVFLAGSCCLFLLNWMLATSFLVVSMQGTISNPKPRQHVVTLVYVKCILSTVDFAWTILGSVLLNQHYVCGDFNAELIVKVTTGCLWFIFIMRVGMVCLFYDPRGKKKTPLRKFLHNEYFAQPVPAGSAKKWRHRLQALCFWFTAPSKDKAVAISTISQYLAFLSHDMDLVASDLIASLKLYRRECVVKHKAIEAALESSMSITTQDGSAVDSFPTPDFPHWMNLQLASRYFSISMGVFGWPWVVYRNLPCGLCSMWKHIRCCFCCRKNSVAVEGDNCCGCNLAGLRVTTGYQFEDLVHVCFVNRVYQIPFFVAIDEETSSVILTLRGSMSFADALTDVAAAFSPVDDENLPRNTLCHGGVLSAARKIKAKLDEYEVLQKAFQGRDGYNLVLMGHSLGAGVACVLTLLLRKSYSSIRCYAFATPPILNECALQETKDCIFTIIFGNDVVPYLNYYNVRKTVLQCRKLFNECQLPKYKVLMGWFGAETKEGSTCPTAEVTISENSKPHENATNNHEKINDEKIETEDIKLSSMPMNSKQTKLLVPGRILHIKHSKFGYRLHICDPEDFHTLVFSPQMVYHHFPQFMEACLKQLGENESVRLKTS